MVDPQIGNPVPHQKIEPAKVLSSIIQHRTHDEEAQVAENNEFGILGLVKRTGGVEMVDTAKVAVPLALATSLALRLVVVVAGHVGEKIHGPSEELLKEQVEGS